MKMNRRSFFRNSGIGAAAISALPAVSLTACQSAPDDSQVLFIGDDIAIADTVYGKVKGFILRDVYTFLGIPYGADTSGKNRFMPPQPPEPWSDVRPAVFPGDSAPQNIYDRRPENYGTFVDHWNYDVLSEDCLRLNVWTAALNDGNKRPVLVWLHGGGFSRGNGIEQDGYNGENMAREGNVVFVSINHRLGAFGFSNFAGVDAQFKDSGNVGALDMVAALQWVHENIANFGGDPENVTIMGQSGGGAKVCVLANMPAAQGLVHKGVPLSGTTLGGLDQDYSEKLGKFILKEAGFKANELSKLQDMPWRDYLDVAETAARKFARENRGTNMRRGGFRPVADGVNIPKGQFFENDSNLSDIPMLFCTTFHEWAPSRTDADMEKISMPGVVEHLHDSYGDKTQAIVDGYAKAFPNAKPIEILALIRSNRSHVVNAANAKLQQDAPVYMAWFGWEPPLFDNRMRAFHCLDISFWFKNTDVMLTHTGGGARPRHLSQKMSGALLKFMQTGDPNGGGLPQWPRYTKENGETMILNDECRVENDPDGEARKLL